MRASEMAAIATGTHLGDFARLEVHYGVLLQGEAEGYIFQELESILQNAGEWPRLLSSHRGSWSTHQGQCRPLSGPTAFDRLGSHVPQRV